MSMLKVLIVDDEPYVRQYLLAIIDWEKYGFYVCGEAENGAEALEMIRLYSPNLVITDIKMPQIDGLEMIRIAVKEMQVSSKFIVLSGYDDFEYARTAMKYNVMDYILKPIEENELLGILDRFRQEIYRELSKDAEFYSSARAIATETVIRLEEGEINEQVLDNARQWLSLAEGDNIHYVLVEIDNYDEWTGKLSDEETLRSSQLIEETIFNVIGKENALNIHREFVYRYGMIVGKNILSRYDGRIEVFTDRLYKGFTGIGDMKVTVCAGTMVNSIAEIKKSFKTCLEVHRNSYFYKQECRIFHYDDRKDMTFSHDIGNIESFHILQEDIENGRQDAVKQHVEDLFHEIQEKLIAPNLVKAYIIKFEFDVFASCMNITRWQRDTNELSEKIAFPDINETRIHIIKKSLLEFCIECADYLRHLKESKSSGILCDIESYILKNYKSNISLKSIAETFYINPVYLGQLFKKKFGMYFNDYLHKLRIEEAMRLLKMTELKIYEIAYMVGYTDNTYFGSKFEKVSGMSPTQYRKSVLSHE
jgi:two-component system response regulator YesN